MKSFERVAPAQIAVSAAQQIRGSTFFLLDCYNAGHTNTERRPAVLSVPPSVLHSLPGSNKGGGYLPAVTSFGKIE